MGTKGPTVNFHSFLYEDLGELINGGLKSGRAYNRTKKPFQNKTVVPGGKEDNFLETFWEAIIRVSWEMCKWRIH